MDKLVTTSWERFSNPPAAMRDDWIREQAAHLPAGSWVLDAGAGACKYRPFFKHCRYETQDFCKYEGPLVRYLEPINYVGDICSIPLPEGCLDAVLCTEVLEHVVDPMAVVREFARLLKPGGRLFLTAPNLSYLHMEPYHCYSGLTHHWYRYWLPREGFSIDTLQTIGGPGMTCSVFSQGFYESWKDAERPTRGLKRWLSRMARLPAKILVHYALPWLLPQFDGWLGSHKVHLGVMVAATRRP
jgi:SAM-dependent methyltransferase